MDLIDRYTGAIDEVTARIEQETETFRAFRKPVCTIPGISTVVSGVICAETGADMTRFATAGHLAPATPTSKAPSVACV